MLTDPKNTDQPLVGLLLAAGASQRFGSPKTLAPLADGTAMALACAQKLAPAVEHLLCVVRPDDTALHTVLAKYTLVLAPEAAQGMSESIKAGLRASSEASGWVIALADMPYIQAQTYQQVANALQKHGGVVAPFHQNMRGHPVGFDKAHFEGLLGLQGDVGAASLLRNTDVHRVEVADPYIRYDIDTPEKLL